MLHWTQFDVSLLLGPCGTGAACWGAMVVIHLQESTSTVVIISCPRIFSSTDFQENMLRVVIFQRRRNYKTPADGKIIAVDKESCLPFPFGDKNHYLWAAHCQRLMNLVLFAPLALQRACKFVDESTNSGKTLFFGAFVYVEGIGSWSSPFRCCWSLNCHLRMIPNS